MLIVIVVSRFLKTDLTFSILAALVFTYRSFVTPTSDLDPSGDLTYFVTDLGGSVPQGLRNNSDR